MNPMLIWAIVLLVAGLGLAILEVFIPSGGILGFLSVMAIVTSIIMAFYYSGSNTGVTFTLLAVVALPAVLVAALKWWPNTAMGRRILLDVPSEEQMLPDADQRHHLEELVGKFGKAKSMMLPGGTVVVEGHLYEAVSEGSPIEAGQAVEVVQIRHNRLVVRPADQATPPKQPESRSDDILSQPIDRMGLDPFDDPLA